MYKYQYKDINITPESKILIGLGDSFTQGQGACSENFWEKYDWDLKKMYKHPDIELLKSEYEGAWVNQLCKNYLTDYIPINFGLRGCGNRSTLKELYLHPKLNIELAKEKIVIYMLSGMERFDFVNKDYDDHHHFFAMWPNPWDKTTTSKKLWEAYAEDIWSEEFAVIELLLNIAELKTWCKANNAKLIISSAFRSDINEENFYRILNYREDNKMSIKDLEKIIDWNNFLYPRGYKCMTDMLIDMEGRKDLLGGGFYGWSMGMKEFSPNKYFTKCSHPSYYGHKEMAKSIYEYIIEKKLLE